MRTLFLVAGLLVTANLFAQPDNETVFTKVEINSGPEPVAWNQFLKKYRNIPDTVALFLEKGEYEIVIEVLVNVHGDAGRFKVLKSVSPEVDTWFLSLLRRYKGRWLPASQCGRLVNSYHRLPIRFRVE